MSIGVAVGLAFIAFLQIAALMGVAYFVLGKWVRGKPRALIAGIIAAAYFAGRIQQAIQGAALEALSDPKLQVVIATYVATLLLLVVRTRDDRPTQRAQADIS